MTDKRVLEVHFQCRSLYLYKIYFDSPLFFPFRYFKGFGEYILLKYLITEHLEQENKTCTPSNHYFINDFFIINTNKYYGKKNSC